MHTLFNDLMLFLGRKGFLVLTPIQIHYSKDLSQKKSSGLVYQRLSIQVLCSTCTSKVKGSMQKF